MKKIILFASLCLASMSSFAQLKVFQNGDVSIKPTTEYPSSPFTINGSGYSQFCMYLEGGKRSGIYSKVYKSSSNWGYGLEGLVLIDSINHYSVGITGKARTSTNTDKNSGRAFGVLGEAGYATPGWNYGVFGRVCGTSYGAGVYGTTGASENGSYVDGRYAGYFNGATKVKGDLTVTGHINGVVLSPTASASSAVALADNTDTEVTATEKLGELSTVSYFKSQPIATASLTNSDTVTTAPTLSAIEIQDLEKKHYALSAEELEEVYPELVYECEDGSKKVNYLELIPILVQSINELNAKIAELEGGGNGNVELMARDRGNATGIDALDDTEVLSLAQNKPNPFSERTTIEVTIPESTTNAALFIYDMNGKQVKQINITERGKTNVSITSEGLEPGMFLYSLIADGKIVSTKKMILTK